MILPILALLSHLSPGCILVGVKKTPSTPKASTGWRMSMVEISPTAAIGSRRSAESWLPSRNVIKRVAFGLALAAGIAGTTDYGYRYWTVGRYLETTDDAYVKADYTTVAPKVSGYIAEILIEDNQRVSAGQILARIDDRDLATALAQARAELAAAEATIGNLDAQIVLQQSVVDQESADIAATEATQKFAAQDDARYRDLMKTGYGTVQ